VLICRERSKPSSFARLTASCLMGFSSGAITPPVFAKMSAAPLEKPIRQEAVNLANELGFDLSRHISTPLVPRDLLCCDLILAMQQEHRDRIISFYPQLADKCRLVADDYDICSPSDGNGKVYAKFAQILENAIEQVIGEILI